MIRAGAEAAQLGLRARPAKRIVLQYRIAVKNLSDHERRTAPVFYCGKPGVPWIGPPRKIVQI